MLKYVGADIDFIVTLIKWLYDVKDLLSYLPNFLYIFIDVRSALNFTVYKNILTFSYCMRECQIGTHSPYEILKLQIVDYETNVLYLYIYNIFYEVKTTAFSISLPF